MFTANLDDLMALMVKYTWGSILVKSLCLTGKIIKPFYISSNAISMSDIKLAF